MPGKRQPLEVLEANGRKHLTKAEKEERRASEVRAEPPKRVLPPKYLADEALRKEFSEISRQLVSLGIFAKLDRDMLAAYLIYRSEWEKATENVAQALEDGRILSADDWSNVQSRFWKGCKSCADALGLHITSRCRLVVPKAKDDAPDDDMEKLIYGKFG